MMQSGDQAQTAKSPQIGTCNFCSEYVNKRRNKAAQFKISRFRYRG